MGDNHQDQMTNYEVVAWVTSAETIEPEYSMILPYDVVYLEAPKKARYAVLRSMIDHTIHVADLYQSAVTTGHPPVIPNWVAQKFKSVEHALAYTRIMYDRTDY